MGVKNEAERAAVQRRTWRSKKTRTNTSSSSPRSSSTKLLGEVKPGETFCVKRPYILIPDGESQSVFNPALSSITFDGEKEHPGDNIEAVKPPTVYT